MIDRALAFLAATDDLIAAALVGIGVGAVTEPGAGLIAFGGLWFLGARLDRRAR